MKYKSKKHKQKPEPTYIEQLEAENAFFQNREHLLKSGYRRVTLELKRKGFKANHKVVMKLMKQTVLTCKVRIKRKLKGLSQV